MRAVVAERPFYPKVLILLVIGCALFFGQRAIIRSLVAASEDIRAFVVLTFGSTEQKEQIVVETMKAEDARLKQKYGADVVYYIPKEELPTTLQPDTSQTSAESLQQ